MTNRNKHLVAGKVISSCDWRTCYIGLNIEIYVRCISCKDIRALLINKPLFDFHIIASSSRSHDLSHCSQDTLSLLDNNPLYLICAYPLILILSYQRLFRFSFSSTTFTLFIESKIRTTFVIASLLMSCA
jgi:hypothetical protein